MAANDIGAIRFRQANGATLGAINIMREKYVALKTVCAVVEQWGYAKHECVDSLNYLSEAGYVKYRYISGRGAAELSDADWRELEGKLTQKGINLMSGSLRDPDIDTSEVRHV